MYIVLNLSWLGVYGSNRVLRCKLIGLKDASNCAYLDVNSGQNCSVRVNNKSFENVTHIFGEDNNKWK